MKKIGLYCVSLFLSLFLIQAVYGMNQNDKVAKSFEKFYKAFNYCDTNAGNDETRLAIMEFAFEIRDCGDFGLQASRLEHLSELYYQNKKVVSNQATMVKPFIEDLHQYYTSGDKKSLKQFKQNYFSTRQKAFSIPANFQHPKLTQAALDKQRQLVGQNNNNNNLHNKPPHKPVSRNNNSNNDGPNQPSSHIAKVVGGLFMAAVVVGIIVQMYRWYRSSVKNGKKPA